MTDAPRDDAQLRASGRALLVAIHGAGRALQLYPVENVAVQRALADLGAPGESPLPLGGGWFPQAPRAAGPPARSAERWRR